MYVAIALPLAVVLATVPAPVLALVFPTQYGAVATLLKYTAVTGLAVGGISLVTDVLPSRGRLLLPMVARSRPGSATSRALLAGWRVDGITGLAAGGALGAAAALALQGIAWCAARARRYSPGSPWWSRWWRPRCLSCCGPIRGCG